MTSPKVYMTDHCNSRVVSAAFAQGCDGHLVPPVKLLDGPVVCYGILRGCGQILQEAEWVNREFYHIDLGYFRRGHFEGYYRVTRNGYQCEYHDATPERFEQLKMGLRPWKRTGRHILICPPAPWFAHYNHFDPEDWARAVVSEVALHTDRPIIVRSKGAKEPLKEALNEAWCLVTHSSNAAVDALTFGVPVISLGGKACEMVSWDFNSIESPWWPDREPWAWCLADNQWTLDEFREGKPMESILSREMEVAVPEIPRTNGGPPRKLVSIESGISRTLARG